MSLRAVAVVFALALACGLVLPATAAPTLVPLAEDPVEGRPVTLRLTEEGAPAAGRPVTAVHRENAHSRLRHEEELGATGPDGSLTWTPTEAGVVVLQWEGGSANVSVLHDGAPIGGVLVALFAGLALLGGSVLFFVRMLRQEEPEIIAETEEIGEPPST